jgi:hypothetical protein
MRVVVTSPTEITHDGAAYGPDEEFDAPDEAARKWIAAGWVAPVSPQEAEDKGIKSEPSGDFKTTRD